MRLTNFLLKNILLFTLILSFVVMQLATKHVHLAKNHSHDVIGHYHQHKAEVHSNHFINQIFADHHHSVDHTSTVELEYEHRLQSIENKKYYSTAIVANIFQPSVHLLRSFIKIYIVIKYNINYLNYSTINPRAPPK